MRKTIFWRTHVVLYKHTVANRLGCMNFDNPVLFAAIGLIALVAGVAFAGHYFAPEARLERRRRRNNYRVVSKIRRPVVTLSVRTRKK